jgi:hypothetical protein
MPTKEETAPEAQLSLSVIAGKKATEIARGDGPTVKRTLDSLIGNGTEPATPPAPIQTRAPMSEATKQKLRDAAKKQHGKARAAGA